MQKEPRISDRSFAHTQGKRMALCNPHPRQNTHLENCCCRPGSSLHHPLSRVPGLFCAHASVAALVVQRLSPPPHSKGFLCPARPAGKIKWCSSPVALPAASPGSTATAGAYPHSLIAFAVTRHRHLPRAGKQGCSGSQPAAAVNLLSSSFHSLGGLQRRASRVTSFILCT